MRSDSQNAWPDRLEPPSAVSLADTPPLPTVMSLGEFRHKTSALDPSGRRIIVNQALEIIEQVYVHLPLKTAMHAVDPIQRLLLLDGRVENVTDAQFHREMIAIFHGLHDLHTEYILPEPYRGRMAVLPLLIERYFEEGEAKYVVSKIARGAETDSFRIGVKVTHWNGVPMELAVSRNAEESAGSNPSARLARGLDSLTMRSLTSGFPPDEDWVTLTYEDRDGTGDIKFEWKVFAPPKSADQSSTKAAEICAQFGLDETVEQSRRAKKLIFAPSAIATERKLYARSNAADVDLSKVSSMPDIFGFGLLNGPRGPVGYIRIWTFNVDSVDRFVKEFLRILLTMPSDALVLDVRGNGGGLIPAGETLLQLFTPLQIEPESLHFRNTNLNRTLCERAPYLRDWLPSIRASIETGDIYSRGFPVLSADDYNRIGQVYQGNVVLVIDALCYSTTDIFIAGFRDHQIGLILGTAENTGAGGANVWTHELLRSAWGGPDSPFQALPIGADFRVALRRTTRVRAMSGVPVEDLGVQPDLVHKLTRQDVLGNNEDLMQKAMEACIWRPVRRVSGTAARDVDRIRFEITPVNLSHVDVMVDGRPKASLDASNATIRFDTPAPPNLAAIELRGYFGARLVCRQKLAA